MIRRDSREFENDYAGDTRLIQASCSGTANIMDVNITTNQPLLLVPKRKGVNKFLRPGSKRQTKVRAFQITYDKAHQGTPRGDSKIQDKGKVFKPKSSSKSSRHAIKSQGLNSTTDQLSSETSTKQTESSSSSRTDSGPQSLQHHSTQDDHTDKQGRASPLRQSTKGLSNQSSQFSSTSSQNRRETRSQAKFSGSVDDGGINIPPDISESDCENVSPSSQTRPTSKRRSPRKSISEITDFLQKRQEDKLSTGVEVVSGEQSSVVKGTPPRKVGDVNAERGELDSEESTDGGSDKARELSEMLAKVKQGQRAMSSPLLSSARKNRNHSRTKNTKLLKSNDAIKSNKNNERDVLHVSENGIASDSESIQTGEKMDEGIVDSVITRSSRSSRTKEKSLLKVKNDRNATEIINSEILEDNEGARTRLRRLEKQLGGMTPLGFRETGETSNSVKNKSRQHENKGSSVSSAQVDNELTSANKVVKSVKSKKHASVSKSSRTKKNIITCNIDPDVGTSTDLQNNDPSQSKRIEKTKKAIQKVASQSSSLHKTKEVEDEDLNVSQTRRGTARGGRSDSENQSRTIQEEISPEQAKKLEKLQKQLGGMSPMDRTLALLSESRAKLSKTMPSMLDLSASQSKDANGKESDNVTKVEKQGTKGKSKTTSSTSSQNVKRRKESSSKQETAKVPKDKIKLKFNKKKNMARGKAKVFIDSDPEEDVEEVQTSESEIEEDLMEELNLSRKRKISDLCDLDIVMKHLKEEGDLSRNDLKKKKLKRTHDDIMSSVMSDMLEMINLNTKMKAVTSLERKGQTKLTKKRRELLELQQEHRKLCGRISDLKRQKKTGAANPATNKEISEFLKSLQQLYEEAGQKSSKGER